MPDRDGRPWWMEDRPSRPRPVENGIQITATRGPVARTWWSQRFLQVLESLGVGGRLARGRTYARQGQIVTFDIAPGSVLAQVQGTRSRPYAVRIGLPTFGKTEWNQIVQALADDASYTAALLNGELPHQIEELFTEVGSALFPTSIRDLAMDCTCPDTAVPCKHLAAVCYVLAERFDADPFLILLLRGREREDLLDELRRRRATPQSAPADGRAPLDELMDRFYAAGDAPGLGRPPLTGPRTSPDALLDQVPSFPITVHDQDVRELLRPLYRALPDAGG
ncbi:Uncharacterized conserved protein, contains Zn finger domain [Pseudonocardia thermophila]|jgi:Uncharacterized conserved protein|uniref:Uncharacterized conserved protein, contains Zn finger domain n=1 Tax=Pseudonocardia thermophila TaxID=1848 RepID=A0A1M6Z1R1_PSETH|nr:SWIM zinc finger family protein [Pseudonocardia thermophila]SHL24313.1 Uncharacterized conserved protein, contains Zn finger domain [Pseudonocardia thermophila]